jgi:hypothetical protein
MDVTLEEAFPAELRRAFDGERFQACLAAPLLDPKGRWTFLVGDEQLSAPDRIYNPPARNKDLRRLGAIEQLMVLCILSRHHDGYVRQTAVKGLLLAPQPWVVPFVLRLTGEYVIEITELICSSLQQQVPILYVDFCSANQSFMEAMSAKAMSYWNCYHRRQYPIRAEYPGLRALRLATGE